jgi:hypothetical protein
VADLVITTTQTGVGTVKTTDPFLVARGAPDRPGCLARDAEQARHLPALGWFGGLLKNVGGLLKNAELIRDPSTLDIHRS